MAFNTWIAGALGLAKRRMDDKKLLPFTDLSPEMCLSLRRDYRVIRFDRRVASFQFSTYDYTGGAHESLHEFSLNWDVERGKEITLDDIFDKGGKWERFVVDYCLEDLERQFGEGTGGPDRSAVARVVAKSGNWMFDNDKAIVHFSVYTVASFASGEFDVEIPYAELKSHMKPDAPVLGGVIR